MESKIWGSVVVAGVVTLITFIAYTSQIGIFWKMLNGPSLEAAQVLLPLNVLVIMIYWNYYLAIITDPGSVPIDWSPPEFEEGEISKFNYIPRYCKLCNRLKPPRTHHCRTCGRCVLQMDHHCPWINNCVGHANYGHFMRFIIYVEITTFYVFVLLCLKIYQIADARKHFRWYPKPTITELVLLITNFCLDIIVFLTVGVLTGYQLYGMISNTTTIEGWEKDKVATLSRRGKIPKTKFPFDLGWYRNYQVVLGLNPLLWLWPKQATGDGLSFPMFKDADRIAGYAWPPRDPDERSIFTSEYSSKRRKYVKKDTAVSSNSYGSDRSERNHVRRDSEGYVVKEITESDRDAMIFGYPEDEYEWKTESEPDEEVREEYYDSASGAEFSPPEYTDEEFAEDIGLMDNIEEMDRVRNEGSIEDRMEKME